MSTIHDALKKVQESLATKTPEAKPQQPIPSPFASSRPDPQAAAKPAPQSPFAPTGPAPKATPKSPFGPVIPGSSPSQGQQKNSKKISWLTILGLIVVLGLAFYASYMYVPEVKTATDHTIAKFRRTLSQKASAQKARRTAAPVRKTTAAKTGPAAPFELTGIMASNGHYFALINGSIVEQGDALSAETRVTEITNSHVILTKDGEDIFLKVKK